MEFSVVEYMVVSCIVAFFTCSGMVILGETSNAFGLAGQALTTTESSSAPSIDVDYAQVSESDSVKWLAGTEQHIQWFIVGSSVCIIGLGFNYIRQGRRNAEIQKDSKFEVKFLKKQSVALRKVINKRNRVFDTIKEQWNHIVTGEGLVENIMSTDLFVTSPKSTIEKARHEIKSCGFRRVMVVDENNHLVGVLSKHDIAIKNGNFVHEIMTSDPKTVSPDTDLRIAMSMLLQNRISCLPVVADGVLVGVISTSDCLITLQCLLFALSDKEKTDSDLDDYMLTNALRNHAAV